MQQTCKLCGRRDKFDFSVTDETWKRVLSGCPEPIEKVVCLPCFDDLAAQQGLSYFLDGPLYFAGDAMLFVFRVEREALGFVTQFWESPDGP